MPLLNSYKQLKSRIPNNWKYPLWYILKAPQRKISSSSLFYDILGIGIYCFYKLVPLSVKRLKPISICTGTYNRSEHYIHRLVTSINQCEHPELIELSVCDCHSDDIPQFEETLRKYWKGALKFETIDRPFSRAVSFNRAVAQSTHSISFICDADMTLPQNIVSLCNAYTAKRRVWYPVYFFIYKNKPAVAKRENGEWELYGSKGMLSVLKEDWEYIGGLNEKYTTWGEEDTELWQRFHQHHFTIIRNKQKDFFHHWHDSFNPKYKHMNERV